MTSLVPSGQSGEQTLDQLRARVSELDAQLRERRDTAARIKSDLEAFRIRYRHDVGRLHEELDRLELELAEAELGVISERVANDDRSNGPPIGPSIESASRALTTDAVRRLFRDVAKAIHPDLAEDEETRAQRHALMIEANRAYALGDEEQLRLILQTWERSPEAVQGSDADAIRLRLERRIEQINAQLELLARDLTAMQESSLGKLKAMVDAEAATGQDLIKDMVRRLKRDILVTTNRLDALRGGAS